MSKQVDPQVRASLVRRLRARRAAGELRTADVRQAAARLGIAERTLWAWLADKDWSGRQRRPRYEITEADRDAYAKWRGNIAAIHRERVASGEAVPSLRRLQAAFARDMTPGERAAAVDGVEGRRRHEVYLRWAPDARNALWEADHKQLPVLVLAPRAHRPRRPWVTLFVDGFSRLIMGWALSLVPHTGTVLAAMRHGIVIDPARGPFGGLPGVLRPDNGLEFAAAALRRSCAALGIELVPTPAYQGYSKGKVERANRTVDQELVSGLPFFTHGPRAADGRLYGPDADPMSLELFTDRFAEWVHTYNTSREHSGLNGQTPLARWCADATPLRTVAAEELRWMLMGDVERTINKDGVHFGGLRFIAPQLNGRVGQRIQVRYTPHDLRQIEIFSGDEWLATAYPQDTLSAQQREAVLARRRADAAELARRQRRASRRARAQLALVTEPGPLVETTTISAQQARDEHRSRVDTEAEAGMRRLALTNLLDLKTDFAYWNPELADESPEQPTGER